MPRKRNAARRGSPAQPLTPAQQERLTALYFEGTHAVRAAAMTGIHFEQVKAFYASWDKTKDKEARDG